MKVCLINPPNIFIKENNYEYKASYYTFPHLGLGYIAANLERNGYEVDIVECCGQNIGFKKLFNILETEDYDIIGLSTYYYNIMQVLRIVERIKSKKPTTFVFAGGYVPTLDYINVMNTINKLDCCVIGEGEITCVELVEAVKNGEKLDNIMGIAYRDEDMIKKTPAREYIKDLDSLPIPKRAFISEKIKSVGIITSRGCYGRCTFCGQRHFYEQILCNGIVARSAKKVVEEIEALYKEHQIKSIRFYDDLFFDSSKRRREWISEFYQLMKERNLRIPFRIEARANDVIRNEDIIENLKEVGLEQIFIGVESLVQRQLDFYEKHTKVEQNLEALKIIKKHNIRIEFGLLILEPFVTFEELIENIIRLKSTKYYEFSTCTSDFISASNRGLIATPGTKIYTQLEEQGKIANNELFYEFEDERVALYYSITQEWKKIIAEFPLYEHLFYMALENNRDDMVEELYNLNSKLKMLDINMVEDICLKIRNNAIKSIEDTESFFKSWKEMFKTVYNKFGHITSCLEQLNS